MNSEWNDKEANLLPDTVQQLDQQDGIPQKAPGRTRLVVVGLGMVSIAFIEKVLKADVQRRQYDIIAIGEENVLAYNRVGLTSFFQHREVENLYLQPETWYSSMPEGALTYRIGERVTHIDTTKKNVKTTKDATIEYDILVIATGSDATLPRHTPNYNANGVFVYRTLQDLQNLIAFASTKKGTTGMVVGGGLLGLEAAKAMMDLEDFGKVKLIERNRWVLSRQLDGEAGTMVVKQVEDLGLDVLLSKRVGRINTDDSNNVVSVTFEDGETAECSCICFAIGIKARDEIAREAGITVADRGGGIVIGEDLKTSAEDVYAIGECSSFEGSTAGLIAPGVEQASVLAHNLTTKDKNFKTYRQPDLSVKLKLLGVEVASFGDFFADRDGPKNLPAAVAPRKPSTSDKIDELTNGKTPAPVKALVYKDPFTNVYKKYIFTEDGKYLLGGMMIGDTSSYIKLVQMTIKGEALKISPGELIVGANKGDDDGGDLADDTQICSCHNVTKGQIAESVKSKECCSVGDLKSVLKVGAGCGGCVPLAESLLKKTLKDMGAEVKDNLCVHFDYSRQDLYNIISVKQLQSFDDIMKTCGRKPDSVGCEVCKPAVTSILSSLSTKSIMSKDRHGLSDTNDAFLANRQRDGTFSVIPRTLGGQITPKQMITVGEVARDFGLSLKIATGQRPDLFGARKQDLPDIWRRLVDVGMTSGHAYAKSVRTVKSCVGSSWCRYGVEDSTGMAIRLETLLSSIRFPHKVKLGVSGCARECAEAQAKDIGLIAAAQGAWNIYVGGNGGAKPRHAELLAKSVATEDVIPIIYRYLAFYQRTADKLQRTARWQEQLPGGIEYLKKVLLEDSLGLCAELEAHMESIVNSYVCEWTETLKDPEKLKLFKQFANTDENTPTIDRVKDDLGQERPAYWLKDTAGKMGGQKWSDLTWEPLVEKSQLPLTASGSSVAVKRSDTQLAIFRVKDKYYSTQQMCPHRRAFVLSDGLIADDGEGKLHVSCPLHKRNYELSGGVCKNDDMVDINTFEAEARDDGMVYVKLPPVAELDSVLGTSKWKIKADERAPFEAFDKKYKKGVKIQAPVNGNMTNGHAKPIAVGGERGSAGIDW